MVSSCEIFNRVQELHILILHDKVYHSAAFAASETLIHIPAGRHDEGRGLLVMERTATLP